jgi:hypothetical protein
MLSASHFRTDKDPQPERLGDLAGQKIAAAKMRRQLVGPAGTGIGPT